MNRTRSTGNFHSKLQEIKLENKHEGHFIKNSDFYSGDKNIWNKPCRSSNKIFAFYHRDNIIQNELVKEKEEKLRLLEEAEKHEIKKAFVLGNRRLAKKNLCKRKIERVLVQKESNQPLEPNVDSSICETVNEMSEAAKSKVKLNKSGFRSIFKAFRGNKWNDLSFINSKYAKMVIPDKVIRKDERAIFEISKRIKEEKEYDELEKLYKKKKHDDIYSYEKTLKSKNDSKSVAKLFPTATMQTTFTKEFNNFNKCNSNNEKINNNKTVDISTKEIDSLMKLNFEDKFSSSENKTVKEISQNKHIESRLDGLHSTEILSGVPNHRLLDKERANVKNLKVEENDVGGIGLGFYRQNMNPEKRKNTLLRTRTAKRKKLYQYQFKDYPESTENTYRIEKKEESLEEEKLSYQAKKGSNIPRAKSTSLMKNKTNNLELSKGRRTEQKFRQKKERSISGRSHYLRTASQKILSTRKPYRKENVILYFIF